MILNVMFALKRRLFTTKTIQPFPLVLWVSFSKKYYKSNPAILPDKNIFDISLRTLVNQVLNDLHSSRVKKERKKKSVLLHHKNYSSIPSKHTGWNSPPCIKPKYLNSCDHGQRCGCCISRIQFPASQPKDKVLCLLYSSSPNLRLCSSCNLPALGAWQWGH